MERLNKSFRKTSGKTYASKFNENKVKAVVKRNRENFDPDAVTEALDFLRNNQGNIIQFYADLQSEEQDDSAPKPQNKTKTTSLY